LSIQKTTIRICCRENLVSKRSAGKERGKHPNENQRKKEKVRELRKVLKQLETHLRDKAVSLSVL
jgi:ABC-type uncharacterized transport system ATPase component